MKNKGIGITLIILLLAIVCCLIIFLVNYLKGGIKFKNGIINVTTKSSNVILDRKFEIEDIKKIEITQNAGDIIFKEATNDYIQMVIYGEDENDINVNLQEDKLTVAYTRRTTFTLFNIGNIKNDIIVFIPSSYSNEIDIKNDYGNCEIIDLKDATVNIDSDAGNVELGKIKNVTIKCDYGNVEIKEILNKCDIKADCGNVEIGKISIQEDSSIKSDLGNVDINETNDIYIDTDVDLGKINIVQNNRDSEITLRIKCDCGNVNVGK